ncbi:MAG: iron-sulfur cluster assembly protein [Thermoplasmata archaeon]|nr:iron-sulfur cluster assembly protein [Thermoplasmata archaeon]MCI4370727.1 iron-sulfur cluster assembly protein [Thermoplasmata archaeon]
MDDAAATTGPSAPTGATGPATPAIPAPAAPATAAASGPHAEVEAAITKELKKIYDPEIPMNIVDLGLIYGFEWKSEEDVVLHMTLTSPGCPVAGVLAEEIKIVMEKVPKVAKATVDFVWEPPWSPEKMSEFARRQFGYL